MLEKSIFERNPIEQRIAQANIRGMLLKGIEFTNEPIARINTIKQLLERLDIFAGQMTDFFQKGFADNSTSGYKLVKSFSKLEEFVYGRIADRVNYDLDVIHRALSQRRIYQEPMPPNQMVRARLEVADTLAIQALRLIQQKQVGQERTSALTYCQRYLRTRVLPYSHIAPIGIPMSALTYDEDLIAIAHEVGHHAYRYLELNKREPSVGFMDLGRGLHPSLRRWVEEIFSDVYGAVIAGPLILTSFIKFGLKTPDHWFVFDDGHHPPPLLRPYIYIDVLRKLAEHWHVDIGDTEQWKTEWSRQVNDRGYSQNTPLASGESNPDTVSNSLTMCEAQQEIAKLTSAIIEFLNPDPILHPWANANDWQNISSMKELLSSTTDFDFVNSDVIAPDQDWFTKRVFDDPDSTDGLTTIEEIIAANPDQIPVRQWIKILRFGDWVEVGPTGLIVVGM